MKRPGRCRDCGRKFKDLRPHIKAEMRKINPRRLELIQRDVDRGDLTQTEQRELATLQRRASDIVLSLG